MKGIVLALSIASATASPSYAEIYKYSCRVCAYPSFAMDGSDGCEAVGGLFSLRVDDRAMILEWRGKQYALTEAAADEEDGCGRYGWHAKGNGKSFTFCTATRGYGAIQDKDGVRAECDLKR